jgi:hypothetical protein
MMGEYADMEIARQQRATQERLAVTIDDRSLLSNSKLRLLSDLGVVSEAHGTER